MAMRARSDVPRFPVAADLSRSIVDCAVQCGVQRPRFADILKAESGPSSPPSRYAGEQLLKLWERVLRLSDDPIIGFRMAMVAGMKPLGALGEILSRCPTVFDAYRQTERYCALVSQGTHVSTARNASTLTVSVAVDVPSGPVQCAIMLWGLTNLSLVPQNLAGVAVRPRAVACAFPSPGPIAARALREQFPFTFDQSHNCVVFDRSVSELRIPSADEYLQSLLAEVVELHLEKLGPAGGFERGLMAILRGMMNGTHADSCLLERACRHVAAHIATSLERRQHQLSCFAARGLAGEGGRFIGARQPFPG